MYTLNKLLRIFYILWTNELIFALCLKVTRCFKWIVFKYYIYIFLGEQYNLTGSSEFAVLGEAFTWTCDMYVPPGESLNAVSFYRNQAVCAVIGHKDKKCLYQSYNSRYIYRCQSEYVYTLTIPAQNMTILEQGSMWICRYVVDSSYRSTDVILKIASKIYIIHMHENKVIFCHLV